MKNSLIFKEDEDVKKSDLEQILHDEYCWAQNTKSGFMLLGRKVFLYTILRCFLIVHDTVTLSVAEWTYKENW